MFLCNIVVSPKKKKTKHAEESEEEVQEGMLYFYCFRVSVAVDQSLNH